MASCAKLYGMSASPSQATHRHFQITSALLGNYMVGQFIITMILNYCDIGALVHTYICVCLYMYTCIYMHVCVWWLTKSSYNVSRLYLLIEQLYCFKQFITLVFLNGMCSNITTIFLNYMQCFRNYMVN